MKICYVYGFLYPRLIKLCLIEFIHAALLVWWSYCNGPMLYALSHVWVDFPPYESFPPVSAGEYFSVAVYRVLITAGLLMVRLGSSR